MTRLHPDIPFLNRVLYASGSLGGNVLSRSLSLWLIFLFAPPIDSNLPTLVPRLLLGALIPLVTFIDSVDDPLIGYWSDRTRSPWGRRIPFVLLATPLYVLTFALLWFPPGEAHGVLVNALFLFFLLVAHRLFSTLSGGPLESLLPEIATTARSRIGIVTWQVFFGAVGAAVGLIVAGILKDLYGFGVMGIILAGLAFASRYVSVAGAWRHARVDVEPVRMNLVQSFRDTFRNDQFRVFLPSFILANMAVTLMTAAFPFYVSAVILDGLPERIALLESGYAVQLKILAFDINLGLGFLVGMLTGIAIGVVLLSLPLVYWLSLKLGKAWVFSMAMLLGAIGYPLTFFMGFVPGVPVLTQSLIVVALAGVPMAAIFTFPNAILADIIDYDSLRTGSRREAMYYGSQAALEKWANALFAPILAGLLLLGETASNPLGVRLVGPAAGVACFVGYFFFRGYRLPNSIVIEEEIPRRHGQ